MAKQNIQTPIPKKRRGVRQNPDGTVSTHLMAREYVPGRGWVAFPTLFQDSKPYADDSQNWVDMSQGPWEDAYKEAINRGEVYDFGEDVDSAINFADKGSWKKEFKNGGNLEGDPPKKLADQVSDTENKKRFEKVYDPLKERLHGIYGDDYNPKGWFNTLPEGVNATTAKFIEDRLAYQTVAGTPADGRVMPPFKDELAEVHNKISNLSDKQIKNLLSTDFNNIGVIEGAKLASDLGIGMSDISRYMNYYTKKISQGYTFKNGGDMTKKQKRTIDPYFILPIHDGAYALGGNPNEDGFNFMQMIENTPTGVGSQVGTTLSSLSDNLLEADLEQNRSNYRGKKALSEGLQGAGIGFDIGNKIVPGVGGLVGAGIGAVANPLINAGKHRQEISDFSNQLINQYGFNTTEIQRAFGGPLDSNIPGDPPPPFDPSKYSESVGLDYNQWKTLTPQEQYEVRLYNYNNPVNRPTGGTRDYRLTKTLNPTELKEFQSNYARKNPHLPLPSGVVVDPDLFKGGEGDYNYLITGYDKPTQPPANAGMPAATKPTQRAYMQTAHGGREIDQPLLYGEDQQIPVQYSQALSQMANTPDAIAARKAQADMIATNKSLLEGMSEEDKAQMRELKMTPEKYLNRQKILNTGNIPVTDDIGTFAMGGNMGTAQGSQDIDLIQGPPHELGGVQVTPQAEAEGGEAKVGNEILSDRLVNPKTGNTFAKDAEKIKAKYADRPNDGPTQRTMDAEIKSLVALNDIERAKEEDKQRAIEQNFATQGEGVTLSNGGRIVINPEYRKDIASAAKKLGMGTSEYATELYKCGGNIKSGKSMYAAGGNFGDPPYGQGINEDPNMHYALQKRREDQAGLPYGFDPINMPTLPFTQGMGTQNTGFELAPTNTGYTPEQIAAYNSIMGNSNIGGLNLPSRQVGELGNQNQNFTLADTQTPFTEDEIQNYLDNVEKMKANSNTSEDKRFTFGNEEGALLASLLPAADNLIKSTAIERSSYQRAKPVPLDLSAQRTAQDREIAKARAIAEKNVRGTAKSSGEALAGLVGANTSLTDAGIQGDLRSYLAEASANQQDRRAVENFNTGLTNQEKLEYSQNKAMADSTRNLALSDIATNLQSYTKDKALTKENLRSNKEIMSIINASFPNYKWENDNGEFVIKFISSITGKEVK